jgi:acyl-CoA synthetase (AMP-forming)/AMP-acid ligase II
MTMSTFELAAESPRTMGDWVRERAAKYGDRHALDVHDVKRSYAEVDRFSSQMAAGLANLGLGVGSHACTMMKNSVESIDVWFGLCKLGAIEIPVNTANRGAPLKYMIDQSDSQTIAIDEEYVDRLTAIVDDLPQLQNVIIRREGLGSTVDLPERILVHELGDLYLDAALPEPVIDKFDPNVIMYTSGTTGPPKGVVICHEANLNLARHTIALMSYTEDDVLYTAFPLFHINARYTSVVAAMECGGSLVMDQKFSVSRFWSICKAKGVTAFNFQGALLLMLFKQPPHPDDADNPVRVAFGAPIPAEIGADFMTRFGVKLAEIYGMTEVPNAVENRMESLRPGAAGRETVNFEVRIVDEQDQIVPAGVAGEIVMRPKKPGVTVLEYYKMPEATVKAFRNLWFHSGDRGRFDEDGYLYFLDRMKDAIRRRGENISSWEVEATVSAHPTVLEAAAYGVPSELSEEEVMLAVVPRPGHTVKPEELLEHCVDNLAHFAVPRYVRFMDELPKTPSQRIEKYRLRAEGVTPDTWDREEHGFIVRR